MYGPLSNVNCASTLSSSSIVSVCGVVVPVRLPVKLMKLDPDEAFAHIVTVSP